MERGGTLPLGSIFSWDTPYSVVKRLKPVTLGTGVCAFKKVRNIPVAQ